ncbi:MAG: flotillin-like FloA family protein, partial [Gemmataceae bacterium]
VGGATEETIIARVGEGIVKAIGSAHDHKEVLANPNMITQTVLHAGLDSQTAYEIVSVDMADIEVGENVGAKLSTEQAAADLKVAQAEAEKRRAAAVAREQEMKALVEENRARVVESEAQVPMAIAAAFKDGRIGVMDYYNMRNLQSDTAMRNNIAGMNGGADVSGRTN